MPVKICLELGLSNRWEIREYLFDAKGQIVWITITSYFLRWNNEKFQFDEENFLRAKTIAYQFNYDGELVNFTSNLTAEERNLFAPKHSNLKKDIPMLVNALDNRDKVFKLPVTDEEYSEYKLMK